MPYSARCSSRSSSHSNEADDRVERRATRRWSPRRASNTWLRAPPGKASNNSTPGQAVTEDGSIPTAGSLHRIPSEPTEQKVHRRCWPRLSGEQLPVPLGDDLDGAVGHLDGRLVV